MRLPGSAQPASPETKWLTCTPRRASSAVIPGKSAGVGGGGVLEIVDVEGRRVAEPVNQLLGPGVYRIPVDASGWSSGVYLYRLEAGRSASVKKMVLLR